MSAAELAICRGGPVRWDGTVWTRPEADSFLVFAAAPAIDEPGAVYEPTGQTQMTDEGAAAVFRYRGPDRPETYPSFFWSMIADPAGLDPFADLDGARDERDEGGNEGGGANRDEDASREGS